MTTAPSALAKIHGVGGYEVASLGLGRQRLGLRRQSARGDGEGRWSMPRPRQRATLEAGLKLDLYRLARHGIVRPGGIAHSCMQWTNTNTGEVRATASITAHLRYEEGSFRIQGSWLDPWILLQPRPRHFGGVQWFFLP